MLKEEFLSMLSTLTNDERRQVQDALSQTADKGDEGTQAPQEEAKPIEEATSTAEAVPEECREETGEETTEQIEEIAEEAKQKETDEQPVSFEREDDAPQEQPQETQESQEEFVAQGNQEQETEMPVDYQSIIDGLNAKIMALEAENKELKAKTEGAFGLVAKPGMAIKANSLYDDDVSDIHFKK